MYHISSKRLRCSRNFRLSLDAGILLLVIFTLLLSVSTARANPQTKDRVSVHEQEATSTIYIGVAAWLSGPYGEIGWAQANSVQLAVDQVNAAGGLDIGGTFYDVSLVAVDDGCNGTGGASAANTLLAASVVAVVGHACSSASMSAQPLYNAAGVPMITPSSTRSDLTLQGYDTTFRTIAYDGSPAKRLAEYLHDFLGINSASTVESTGWGDPGNYFTAAFSAAGGTVISRQTVSDPSGFNAALTAIQPGNPDAVVDLFVDNSTPGASAGQFSKQAYDLGMTGMLIGWSSNTNDTSVLADYETAAGAATEGDVVVMYLVTKQDMLDWDNFLADYVAAGFTNEPDDPADMGPYAYDAAMIILQAIDRADSTSPSDIRDEIALMQDYAGVVGVYKGFDSNGDVIPQWSWFVRYRSGQWLRMFPGQVFLPVLFRPESP